MKSPSECAKVLYGLNRGSGSGAGGGLREGVTAAAGEWDGAAGVCAPPGPVWPGVQPAKSKHSVTMITHDFIRIMIASFFFNSSR